MGDADDIDSSYGRLQTKSQFGGFRRFWSLAWKEFKNDLKVSNFIMDLAWRPFLLLISAFISLILCIGLVWSLPNDGLKDVCLPDNNFNLNRVVSPNRKLFDRLLPSDIFLVTLGFGQLTFSQAKAIDVCWDLVSEAT